MTLVATVASVLIVFRHRGNLARIARGTERRLGQRAAVNPVAPAVPDTRATMQQVAVIGSGKAGARPRHPVRSSSGHDVRLWGRDPALVAEMAARRANPVYLADATFPDRLRPTAHVADALDGATIVVVAVCCRTACGRWREPWLPTCVPAPSW
ncbi:MAG: hypothetical protein R2712_04090 [Vicinamibacterales bacterium]